MYKKLLMVDNNAKHLFKLINRLMDFRKLENNRIELKAAEGNIVAFMHEVYMSFSEYAKDDSYDYTFISDHDEILAYYDHPKLERVFFNLISNAFRYTSKGGKINIEIIKREKEICICVKDTGVGIAEEHIDKIFDRFFEIPIHNNQDDNYVKGTGIGLSIVNNIVKLHKGVVEVKNREEKGTIFEVKLPLGKNHLSPIEINENTSSGDDLAQYESQLEHPIQNLTGDLKNLIKDESKATILIVEDNNSLRSFIGNLLRENYNIVEAENGAIAFEKALKHLPDIIISDVVMPKMTGTKLCTKIKEDIRTSHIPVILLTSRSSLIYKFEGLESGADDYINKPFIIKEFNLKIKNLLDSTQRLKKKFSEDNSFEPSNIVLTSVDEELLKKAFKIAEDNIDNEKFDTNYFCSELGVSRALLFTKIKAWTNFTPNEFILEFRLKRAAQLLEQNKIPISEICYHVGYQNQQYFRELFKKKFGKTPSQYQSQFSGKLK